MTNFLAPLGRQGLCLVDSGCSAAVPGTLMVPAGRWDSSSSSSEPPGAVSCSSAHASIGRLEAEKKCFFHSTLPAITVFLSSLYLKKSSLLPGPEVNAFLSAALTATRLLGFSSSRALKFVTSWGFFPYLQLSTWDSIFFFILPFKSPENKTPDSGTIWAPIHLLNPVSLARFCSTEVTQGHILSP